MNQTHRLYLLSQIAFGALAWMGFMNSTEARTYNPIGDALRGYHEITECEFKPLRNNAQVWFPYMYIDTELKGVYIPAFSQGAIRMNPELRSKAPLAWTQPKTYHWGSAWVVIPETNYTSTIRPTAKELELTEQMLRFHRERAKNVETPTNYSIQSEVGGIIERNAIGLYKRFLSATGAEQLNKAHCDRFVTKEMRDQGWFNGGNAYAPRAPYDLETGGNAKSRYYVISKELYGISDIYFLESLDGSVNFKGEKTFVFGQTTADGKADSVFGCNICRKRVIYVGAPFNPKRERVDFLPLSGADGFVK
jgi:hypothetical protein